MGHNPIDVTSRVSPRLSALIESRVNDPDAKQPITLNSVRIFLAAMLSPEFKEAERLHHFDLGDSMLDELDALIEEYGGSVLAIDFAQQEASNALSEVIEAVMNDDSRDNAPSLETVRDAIMSGLPASLVGEGVLEEEDEAGLLPEIDALIDRFGADALAEQFLHYE
jgi:hypothetical protein